MPWVGLGSFTYNATSFHCYDNHWSLIFDDYHTEVYDKYELVEGFTWDHVLHNLLYLQSRDTELNEMWEIVDKFEMQNMIGGKL